MIRKTITLLKKDMMLIEKYSLLAVLILIAFPIFLNYAIQGIAGPAYLMFLSLDFCAFVVFGQIYLMESKYKGMTYLMICPFTRTQMLVARYVLLILICGLGTGCYKVLEVMNPGKVFSGNSNISMSQAIVSVSIVLIAYDALLPILDNYAYEKVRLVHAILSIMLPVWGVVMVKALLQHFQISLTVNEITSTGTAVLLALDIALTAVSIAINKKLWEMREF